MSGKVSRKDYPNQAITLGEHIRKVRIDRRLQQKEVARHLNVDDCSVNNWENNHTEPELRFIPRILEFLGYNPVPCPDDTLEKLAWYKWSRGLNYDALGKEMGKSPEQLMDWIAGRHKPFRKSLEKIEIFLRNNQN